MPGAYSREKIRRILAAARDLFALQGFAATTMDAVAAQAGVGKATVYARFGNKDDLFRAVVEEEGRARTTVLAAGESENFEDVLRRFGLEAFDLLLSPSNISTFRMVSAEAARSPHLGRVFFETGPDAMIQALADFLARGMEKGAMRPGDSRLAAAHFLGLICGDLQVRGLLGQSGDISATVRERLVSEGVRAFLSGYGKSV